MSESLNFQDLFIRILVISVTSLIVLFVTQENKMDFHFKIRKKQNLSPNLFVIENTPDIEIDKLVNELRKRKAKHIYVNQFLYDQQDLQTSLYSTSEFHPHSLSLKLKPDPDGILRKVQILSQPGSFFPNKLIKKTLKINFRGAEGTFPQLYYYDLVNTKLDLSNHIVVIKTSEPLQTYTSPVGLITESEIIANLVDNNIEKRFIPDSLIWIELLVLFFILVVTTLLLIYLPSTLALLSTFVFCVFYVFISLWVFDHFYIWTPIIGPVIQIILTFLLISNYKYVLNEKTRWSLEKESLYFERVEEMKTNFLSLFSHDLKTPLAKIIGITDTLIRKTEDQELRTELEKIKSSSKDLEKYIQRILKTSQVQSKNLSLKKEASDINQLIEKAVSQNSFSANEKSISIEKNLSPLFMIEIDAVLIQEVITNFIENAITYSPKGSEIRIVSMEEKEHVKVSVQDQGPGIPKEIQDSVWEKYYRFDNKESGYGLGLFLSRFVIELHGGRVYLNSRENHGSEFGFILPLEES